MTTLAGILFIRNADALDYCWRQAAESLLAVCNELVISDCESTDGSRQAMDELAKRDNRVKIVDYKWPEGGAKGHFCSAWRNAARLHANSEWIMWLDADEVIHEDGYAELRDRVDRRQTLICPRFNFWKDAQHLIPHGCGLGHQVIRVGPQCEWTADDGPDPQGRDRWLIENAQHCGVKILHYGFLRKREAFFNKAREMSRIYMGNEDERLMAAEKDGGNWMMHPRMSEWKDRLITFNGSHPKIIHQWLTERGWHP